LTINYLKSIFFDQFFFTAVFFTSVLLVTVFPTVSTFALDVSVAGFTVSSLSVVSVLLFIDDDESTFAESFLLESPEPAEPLPLHAASDTEIQAAIAQILSVFFMVFCFNVLIANKNEPQYVLLTLRRY
jgi:hypothetical protein